MHQYKTTQIYTVNAIGSEGENRTRHDTVTVGDFSTVLSSAARSSRQKTNQVTSQWHHSLKKMNLKDTLGPFHPTATSHTSFSSNTNHTLSLKSSLSTFQRVEIMLCIFSDHKEMKLKLKTKNTRAFTNTWKLNNMMLNDQWVIEEI